MWPSVGKKSAGTSHEEEDEQEFTYAGMVCHYANAASTTWIIDSGASDHMTGNFEILENAEKCRSEPKIYLPTGHTSGITHKGLKSGKIRGIGKEENGLYYLINESMKSIGKKLAKMKKLSGKVALNTTSTVTIPGTEKCEQAEHSNLVAPEAGTCTYD
uniref:Retrovirus-related Pol polyprotein from transposon TNT 1-94-like beta-barrel domain-containing protein n=1 Tax=Chenopodium quinoa TaxID=63459 RepID=A0A803KNI6_CHEQI